MKTILQLNNVSFTYHSKDGEISAVENISFSIFEGEFIGIVGPSGCGKSTLLNLLAHIDSPSNGDIKFNGEPLDKSYTKIALMPQRDQLFEWRSIEKNALLGVEISKQKNKKNKVDAREMLKKYGLGDYCKKHPSQLSGGMRQRAALIRTLMTEPDILLLDEPFSALDFQTRLKVCDDVYSIIKEEKKTAVLVSHDISECISLCDRIIVLSPRPAKIVETIAIDINKKLTPLMRREDPLFPKYFDRIWKILEDK